MAAYIEAAATARRPGRVFGRGARHLSDAAAATCLRRSDRHADELDLLVHTGIYKDANTAEPALAAIVHEDIGANATSPPRRGHHGTFSFDVANGGCGVVTALELVDAFVGPGSAQLAMVVAGDADPSPYTTHGYPFAPAGGALLVAHRAGGPGFVRFAQRTFAGDAELFTSELRWEPQAGFMRRGRNVIDICVAPEFAARCVEHAAEVARELIDGVTIDLVIASQYPRGFDRAVADALGLPPDRVPEVAPGLAGSHTAGPIAALEAAIDSGRFAHARHVLLVTAGAGITIGAALYAT